MKSKSYKFFTFFLISPWLLILTTIWLYPLLYSAYLSTLDYNSLTSESTFIGLKNYFDVLQDNMFWHSLKISSIFTLVTVPLSTILALAIALMLNSKLAKFKNFFRAIYFLPSITSIVVLALIFTNIYSKDGYLNLLLNSLNLPYPERGWLLNENTALIAIMAMDIWISTGYYMVLFLAALQTVSQDYYDNARLSGATFFQQLRMITLPLIKPTLLFVLIINTIKSLQVFVEIIVMTKGGPLKSTTTVVYQVFKYAFDNVNLMGYASAISYILFFILIIASFIQTSILKENNS
jgi:multiple sugar transport system permease protein